MDTTWLNRNGVWVMTTEGVAIRVLERVAVRHQDGVEVSRRTLSGGSAPLLADESVHHEAQLHFTNADGTTRFVAPDLQAFGTRLAKKAEIPPARVAALTDAQLSALGYV